MAVETYAGDGAAGTDDGPAGEASFMTPVDLDLDAAGNLYVVDNGAHQIRVITPDRQVRTLAGTGERGLQDGPGAQARFAAPRGLAVSPDGTVYVCDALNHRIRRIDPAGNVTTLAGDTFGFADGQGMAARFDGPTDIVAGPGGDLFITDRFNERIRRMTAGGAVTTYVEKFGILIPTGIAVAGDGTLFVTQPTMGYVRSVSPTGAIAIHAGGGYYRYVDGPPGTGGFDHPTKLAVGPGGTLYVPDTWNHRIRVVDASGSIATLAGSGPLGRDEGGFADGPGDRARFFRPCAVVVGPTGELFVADSANRRIRRIVF